MKGLKNKEELQNEIIEAVLKSNTFLGVKKEDNMPAPCNLIPCSCCKFNNAHCSCLEAFRLWAEQYPVDDIDWDKVPVDTHINVVIIENDKKTRILPRHFASFDKGGQYISVYRDGKTSFTATEDYNIETYNKCDCKLVKSEDIEKYCK